MYPDAACWHEAGHAYIAHLLGGRVQEVSIESELDDHEGHTAIAWDAGPGLARCSALVALAGPVAELLYREAEPAPAELRAWRGDWAEAEARCAELEADPSARPGLLHTLIGELVATLEDPGHWERMARVADGLHAHGTLDESLFGDALS